MRIAIHQPNFLPWLGYFYKIRQADRFIFLDTAQYTKNSFINRNRIQSSNGTQWLTVPAATSGQFGRSIRDTQIAWRDDWRRKHLATLRACYGRAPHFAWAYEPLEAVYAGLTTETSIADFNIRLVQYVCGRLALEADFICASELQPAPTGASTELLVEICRTQGANEYLAGTGARQYQDDAMFAAAGIGVRYSGFTPHAYCQGSAEFVGGLSVLDALMHCGPDAVALMRDVAEAD